MKYRFELNSVINFFCMGCLVAVAFGSGMILAVGLPN